MGLLVVVEGGEDLVGYEGAEVGCGGWGGVGVSCWWVVGDGGMDCDDSVEKADNDLALHLWMSPHCQNVSVYQVLL